MKRSITTLLFVCAFALTLSTSALAYTYNFYGEVVCEEGGGVPGHPVFIEWQRWLGYGGQGSATIRTNDEGGWQYTVSSDLPTFNWFKATTNHVTHVRSDFGPGTTYMGHHRLDCNDTGNDMDNPPIGDEGAVGTTSGGSWPTVKALYR